MAAKADMVASEQAPTLQALAVCLETHTPVILIGGPGTGKTSAVQQLAHLLDMEPVEVLIGSIREPTDFLWEAHVEDGKVSFGTPGVVRRLQAAGKGILFLDEGNSAPPAVQSAMLRVVQEKVFGESRLPAAVSVAMAVNPVGQAAGGWLLAPPMANRMCHLHWSVTATEWAKRFLAGWPAPTLQRVPAGWEGGVQAVQQQVTEFVARRGGDVLFKIPDDPDAAGGPWPSPRTWEMAARLLAASDAAGVSSVVQALLVQGAVGVGAGAEFLAERKTPVPDIEEFLAGKGTVPSRQDVVLLLCDRMIHVLKTKPTGPRWGKGWNVLRRISEVHGAELVVSTAKRLVELRQPGWEKEFKQEDVAPIATVLRQAGLL